MLPIHRILPIALLAQVTACMALAQAPAITSISPNTAVAGSPSFTLTVNGTGFAQCVPAVCLGIDWAPPTGNPVFLTAAPNSAGTQLIASIPASLIASPGIAYVSVQAAGGTSYSVPFSITSPVITSLMPASIVAGGPAFPLVIGGAGFFDCSVSCLGIEWQTASGAVTFIHGVANGNGAGTQMTVTVPASLITKPGTANISMQALGGTSKAVVFTILPPSITLVSPSSAVAGGPAFALTVSGTGLYNFSCQNPCQPFGIYWTFNGVTSQLGGSPNANSTAITTNISADLIAKPGTATISVVALGGPTNSISFVIHGPPPNITSISPASAPAGSPAVALTLTGANFLQCVSPAAPCLGVNWQPASGSALFFQTAANAAGTQMIVTIPAGLLTAAGTAGISVRAAGGTSGVVPFTIASPTSLSITALSPNKIQAGSAGFTLTVTGAGFVSGAAVVWNQTTLTTTFGSATQLSAAVPASLVAQAGTASVTVVNPGGAGSNPATFTISNPPPSISNVEIRQNSQPNDTLTVSGGNFLSGAVIQWNGGALPTTFGSASVLSATVPASMFVPGATIVITVLNPDGQVSNAITFTANSFQPPVVTSLSPSPVTAAGPAFTLTVNGAGFVSGAVINWNGAALVTTFVSDAQLTASVTAALIANPGTASITVTNPNSKVSAPVTLTIALPPPPSITFAGPGTISPLTNENISFSIAGGYPFPLNGQVTLTFQPNVVNSQGTDPAVQFAGGGTVLGFQLDANSTTLPSIAIQTGSTAGTITATLLLAANDEPVFTGQTSMEIPESAPVIESVQLSQTSSGVEVTVKGYATSREVTQATFDFTASPGVTLTTSTFPMTVTPIFTTWYSGTGSQPYGSQFTYTETFAIQGSSAGQGVASVSVTLSNTAGTSAAVSSN